MAKAYLCFPKIIEFVKEAEKLDTREKRMKFMRLKTIEIIINQFEGDEAIYSNIFREYVQGVMKYAMKMRLQKNVGLNKRSGIYEGVKTACVILIQIYEKKLLIK